VVLGLLVLHEKLNWRLFAGGACIISGLGLIVFRKPQKILSKRSRQRNPTPNQ